ncbi:hypothetical protein BDZ45DRAFT_309778 [Acephala macrosclerotiorum]|nr:hypothetical protein BDZ45DRAFT_309778 [Acephala macrosclerotiorum]
MPPPQLVIEKRYHYRPCPVDVTIDTYLPEMAFWHQFYNPHDCIDGWWLNRLPTKLTTRLVFTPESLSVGWGLHIEETLNFGAATILFVGIVLCSCLISLIWSVLRDDVSGGFGVGSFLTSVGSIVLTMLFFHRRRMF